VALSRRNFLRGSLAGLGAAAATRAISPLIRIKPASAAGNGKRVVIVGIGGGLRTRESLGMAEGATMPNLFGTTPLVGGGGPAGVPKIDTNYEAAAPLLVLPPVRPQPLFRQGTLITNLRYAEGPPGHLQGHGCLLSGFYNQIENRADAHLPVPTIFELHRRATNAPATDAWYLSQVGGFYRALIASNHAGYGTKYAGVYLQPPGVMQPLVSIATSGKRELSLTTQSPALPVIPSDPAEDIAASRLTRVLDGNSPGYAPADPTVHLSAADNEQIQNHLAEIYADNTYDAFFPKSYGIGTRPRQGGDLDGTADAKTIYHAERVLQKFKPAVMAITLLDVDVCHSDFNGYLRAQQLADALVNHLWNHIQSIPELRDTTTMIVLPEHGRHLFGNGKNPDAFGRTGIDHGQGDNGDRDVWMLALGPDIKQNQLIAPTGISQPGRTSGRYETIDTMMTAMSLLGHDGAMKEGLVGQGARPGLMIPEVMR
jgi:hypothetical protein